VPSDGSDQKVKAFLLSSWNGEISLPKTFWLTCWFGDACAIFGAPFLFALLRAPFTDKLSLIAISSLLPVAQLSYAVFSVVSTWHSANRYKGSKYWAFAAKVFAVVFCANVVIAAGLRVHVLLLALST
jgi:hypothetical protein